MQPMPDYTLSVSEQLKSLTASGALQIAIVLASASIVTSTLVLAWLGVGLGVVGLVFCSIAFFAPLSIHIF